jgi:hypothetical protein
MFEGIKKAMNKVWGRKTFITLVCLISGTLVDLFAQNGLSANYMTLLGTLAGAFAVGNGMEHMATRKTEPKSEPVTQETPVSIEPQLAALNQSMATVMDTLSYIIKATGLDNPQAYQSQQQQAKAQAEKNRIAAEKYLTDPE